MKDLNDIKEDIRGGKNGRWSTSEHTLFLSALSLHERNWKLYTSIVTSRSVVQIRTHAQKYFKKQQQVKESVKTVAVVKSSLLTIK